MPVAEQKKISPKDLFDRIMLFFIKNPFRVLVMTVAVFICIACAVVGFRSSFTSSKDAAKQQTSDVFYQKVYDFSEAEHHVSSDITIYLDSLKEIQNLEVLHVVLHNYQSAKALHETTGILSNIPFITAEGDAWYRFTGQGVFTVDLSTCVTTVDEQRGSVLIQVASPSMRSHVTLKKKEEGEKGLGEKLYFSAGGILSQSSLEGGDDVKIMSAIAQRQMTDEARSNAQFYSLARESAKTTIVQLVRELNPHLPNLTVTVEFID